MDLTTKIQQRGEHVIRKRASEKRKLWKMFTGNCWGKLCSRGSDRWVEVPLRRRKSQWENLMIGSITVINTIGAASSDQDGWISSTTACPNTARIVSHAKDDIESLSLLFFKLLIDESVCRMPGGHPRSVFVPNYTYALFWPILAGKKSCAKIQLRCCSGVWWTRRIDIWQAFLINLTSVPSIFLKVRRHTLQRCLSHYESRFSSFL